MDRNPHAVAAIADAHAHLGIRRPDLRAESRGDVPESAEGGTDEGDDGGE